MIDDRYFLYWVDLFWNDKLIDASIELWFNLYVKPLITIEN